MHGQHDGRLVFDTSRGELVGVDHVRPQLGDELGDQAARAGHVRVGILHPLQLERLAAQLSSDVGGCLALRG